MKVTIKRHIVKTISYRILSSTIGFFIMWFISGDVKIGTLFGFGELVLKPFIYFLHERIWYRYIKYGLKR